MARETSCKSIWKRFLLVIFSSRMCLVSAVFTRLSTEHYAAYKRESANGRVQDCTHDRTHLDTIFRRAGITSDALFSSLLKHHDAPSTAAIVEVGVYDGKQCAESSLAGFHPVICFEPSPANLERSRAAIEAAGVGASVSLVKKALGNRVNQKLKLQSKGGSGDHVGEIPFAGETAIGFQPKEIVEVESSTLDAHLNEIAYDGNVYIVKIDTQGFDGVVMEGMHTLMAQRRVDFVIFELWPKAMLHEGRKACNDTLRYLTDLNYRLYELAMPENVGDLASPVTDLKSSMFHRGSTIKEVCDWYESDELSNSFGTWTDVLAVSPLKGFD